MVKKEYPPAIQGTKFDGIIIYRQTLIRACMKSWHSDFRTIRSELLYYMCVCVLKLYGLMLNWNRHSTSIKIRKLADYCQWSTLNQPHISPCCVYVAPLLHVYHSLRVVNGAKVTTLHVSRWANFGCLGAHGFEGTPKASSAACDFHYLGDLAIWLGSCYHFDFQVV